MKSFVPGYAIVGTVRRAARLIELRRRLMRRFVLAVCLAFLVGVIVHA